MKDLTDLDYKDLFRDAVNMMAHIARAAGFDPADPTVEPPAIMARVENLRAEAEESRLALAAEIGNIKGAPSARWTTDGHNWYGARSDGGMDKIERWSNLNGDGTIKHGRGWTQVDRFGFEREMGRFDLARAAMLAADAAHPSTPETDRP